ncbi:hypothetical protein QTI66_37770 [Variovorax sp. J22R133]|uniref:hypothetical protein n=1 Tax=Variovorax brevis TaxID=3053503 RepID=UPI0025749922|nr:hypothetical protein [Variovorax sp. J22R133]MDM0117847.1 hypothetical protein [Variovorax sp. J22R133]
MTGGGVTIDDAVDVHRSGLRRPSPTLSILAALGQTVTGVIQVLDATGTIELELPGVLCVIASGLKERLQEMAQLLLTKK